jgi:hypothetical protein
MRKRAIAGIELQYCGEVFAQGGGFSSGNAFSVRQHDRKPANGRDERNRNDPYLNAHKNAEEDADPESPGYPHAQPHTASRCNENSCPD